MFKCVEQMLTETPPLDWAITPTRGEYESDYFEHPKIPLSVQTWRNMENKLGAVIVIKRDDNPAIVVSFFGWHAYRISVTLQAIARYRDRHKAINDPQPPMVSNEDQFLEYMATAAKHFR